MRPLQSPLATIALATGFLLGLPADAGMMAERAPSMVVKLGDLDLSTVAGLRRAHARIRRAAETVCDNGLHSDPIAPVEVRRCRAMAISAANSRLAPLVVANR